MKMVNENVRGSAIHQFCSVLLANIPIFVYGVQIGWMSPMAPILQSETGPALIPLSDSTISWMASSLCFSAIFAVPLFGIIADKLGRKPAIIMLSIPQAEAAKSLAWLRSLPIDDATILKELNTLKYENDQYCHSESLSVCSIVRSPSTMKAFTICIVLMTIQTVSGCFAVVTYASDIFSRAGGNLPANVIAVGIGLTQLVGSFVATFTLEKFGRKFLMATSTLVMGLCMAILGSWFYLLDYQHILLPSWIPLSAVGLSIFCNATGVAPVPFVVVSEIFNFQVRATMASAILMYTWTNNSLVLYSFKPVAASFGSHTAFFIFATVCLFGGIYTIICIPETKGKSVEEIHRNLMGNKTFLREGEEEMLEIKN